MGNKKLKVKTAKRDIPIWKVVYRGQLLPPKGGGYSCVNSKRSISEILPFLRFFIYLQ